MIYRQFATLLWMMDYLLLPLTAKKLEKLTVKHLFILSETKFMISEEILSEPLRNVFDVGNE